VSDIKISDFSIQMQAWGRYGPTPREMVELSQRAEKSGYHGVGMSWSTSLPSSYGEGEGIFTSWPLIMEKHPGYYVDALAVLPMIAQATSTIRFGLNAFIVPAFHPFYVAKYLATLDVASGGRLTTAFGFGVSEADGTSRMFEWLGSTIPAKRRGDAAEEALEVITRLWTESELLDHRGEFFFGKQMLVEPKPVQNPYPEVWWAGERKRSLRMAARFATYLELSGQTIAMSGHRPSDRIREFYAPGLDEANEEYGGLAKLAIRLDPRVTEKPVTAKERAALYWYEDRPELAGLHEVLPAGSPEQCAEVVSALREAGVEHFVLDFSHLGYESLPVVTAQLEAWASEVVPLLSEAKASV
jgi:alkanesulfonate monooxygenase SsuD/methylene tetrahydromethanopterin reductase-like flavin-dependent oxidoreductase (luciferase family)